MKTTLKELQSLGFSEYEARAYVALLKSSPLNGYELAKASGLPRANVYSVLQKLEERGAVVRLDEAGGVRYSPVPAQELIDRIRRRYEETLDSVRQGLEELTVPAEREYVWNARGYPIMVEHARALVDGAQEKLLLAVWPPEAEALAASTAAAEKRGVKVTTLCLEGCQQECGHCRGHLYRYPVVPEQGTRWLVIVPDGAELLTSEIGQKGDEALTVRTRQRLLVDLARWYIRHSIALAAVINDLGDGFENLLQPATRSVLASIGPDSQTNGWLEHMHRLLSRRKNKTTN